MQQVMGAETVHTILEVGDTIVKNNGYAGVAVELVDRTGEVDGTIVYYPGASVEEIGEVVEGVLEGTDEQNIGWQFYTAEEQI